MKLSHFFIERPIFAAVLSAFITIAGAIALFRLPVSAYPEVVPPSVVVRAAYPGANPKVIAETVAAPLEQAIVGVEDMMYMSSQAAMDGTLVLTVTFKIGADVDRAQVQVQNRVAQALPRLPQEVRDLGVTTTKSSPNLMMVVHLTSPDGRYDSLYLRNYAVLNVRDVLARLPGMGEVRIFGAGDYSMRIWLDPEKLAVRNLTTDDVISAVREQNVQVAAGQIGAPPGQTADFQVALTSMGRLEDESQFRDIVIKTDESGRIVRLGDVARVELGAQDYALRGLLNNQNAVALPIAQAPGSNALELSKNVRATMEELKKNFPEGVKYTIIYDTTEFVQQSIEAVFHTLLEAIALVVLVVILFLQTWRASIIPLVAVPVSVIGTFAVLLAFGFSINTLSLFGLVLAIGIVVDDAIVVVENVERHIAEGLSPKEATKVAMSEVSRPIIAITLVLCAVFVPVAFVSGLTGEFYRQFALTIAISAVISAFNSLTLSPALAAALLKPHGEQTDWLARTMHRFLGKPFAYFNRGFERTSNGYRASVVTILRRSGIAVAIYGGLILLTIFGFTAVPGGFIPAQDKQYVVAVAQLPPAASLGRTEEVTRAIGAGGLSQPGVEGTVQFAGMSTTTLNASPSSAMLFFKLDPFSKRHTAATSVAGITAALNRKFSALQEAYVGVFPPPPIQGMGTFGGFKLFIEDRSAQGTNALYQTMQEVIGKAYKDPALAGVFSSYQVNVPQLSLNVDRIKAKQLGVKLSDIFQTMQVYLGSLYVNDFNRFGRTYQVVAQADSQFRAQKEDILRLKTRNARGEMVPLGALVTVTDAFGPDVVSHYNGFLAADLNGGAAPGYSSGQAQEAISKILNETLPRGMTYEWTDLSYQQSSTGNTTGLVFALCVVFVFLVLAAQYESLSLPIAIVLIVPMCLLAGIGGVVLTHGDNNIFTQIGLVVLVGLASKNAILIVEFARHLEEQGLDAKAAVLEAARLRLRPILMTSIAFIAGVIPLVFASGAGAEIRKAMGVVVFSGMLGVTVFGLLLTPVFYVLVRRNRAGRKPPVRTAATAAAAAAAIALSACAVGPNYVKPDVHVEQSYETVAPAPVKTATAAAAPASATPAASIYTSEASIGEFWTQFNDPVLSMLSADALRANHDLRIAAARFAQARAARGESKFDLGPTITASGGYTDQLYPQAQAGLVGARQLKLYDAGFDAVWELDFFGRIRRSVEAASADAQSAEADLRNAQIVVVAEVARTYFELRGEQSELDVARRNVENQRAAFDLTNARLDAGRGTEFDTSRAQAQLSSTLGTIGPLEAAVARSIHSLSVLTGREPTALTSNLSTAQALPTLPQLIPVGNPADLLRRRPDIRAAERNLAAATARIGVATADLFPKVSFVGGIGLGAASFNGLDDQGSGTRLIAPGISWAAFDLGRVRQQILGARARNDAALATYEQTVLRALQETEDALVTHARSRDQLLHATEGADASETAARLARIRFEGGMVDFLQVLDAERTQLEAESRLARSRTDAATSLIALYKALGGGWQTDSVSPRVALD